MDWISIIGSLLLPIITKCWTTQENSDTDPQEYLRANYDSATGRMSPDVVNAALSSTRKAMYKAKRQASKQDRKNFPRFTKEQIYNIAEKNLIDAMIADDDEVSRIYSEAMQLGDDD